MYNCSASRPKIGGKTNEDKKNVQTETLTIKAVPLADGKVKAKTGDMTDGIVYQNWYRSVYVPGAAADDDSEQAVKATRQVLSDNGKNSKSGKALS